MTTIINSPLNSTFGFSSPNFSVDAEGNVVARSITQSEGVTSDAPPDFSVIDSGSNAFFIAPAIAPNPPISVFRSSNFIFGLDLDTQTFNLYLEDQSTLYFSGLKHSDGSSGEQALSKQSGRLSWLVPISAPDVLYYGNLSSGAFGLITVGDAVGQFSTVNITEDVESTSTETGSLVVTGGVGISSNLNVGGIVSADELISTNISSLTSLSLTAGTEIIITIDNVEKGTIGVLGLTMPIANTTINNTVIGNVTPATATFVSASITELPTANNNITNKLYVDNTATALAIAFGI